MADPKKPGEKAPLSRGNAAAPGRRDNTEFVGPPPNPAKDKPREPLVATPNAYIVVTEGGAKGTQYTIQNDKLVLGRHPPADVVVDDAGASRRHAQIYRKDNRWFLKDLGSTNGTNLDGLLRGAERPLFDGDVFRIGAWEFAFSDPASRRR